MTKVQPIDPDNLIYEKAKAIPDQVISVFNRLIAQKWDGKRSIVYVDDVVESVISLMKVSEGDIVRKNWLDIEQIYNTYGYDVTYYKPKYGESFPAYYRFEKKMLG